MEKAEPTDAAKAAIPESPAAPAAPVSPGPPPGQRPKETGGPKGPDPTRYGDWERNGRCVDF